MSDLFVHQPYASVQQPISSGLPQSFEEKYPGVFVRRKKTRRLAVAGPKVAAEAEVPEAPAVVAGVPDDQELTSDEEGLSDAHSETSAHQNAPADCLLPPGAARAEKSEKAHVDARKFRTTWCKSCRTGNKCPYRHTCCFAHWDKNGASELRDGAVNEWLLLSIGFFHDAELATATVGAKPMLPLHFLFAGLDLCIQQGVDIGEYGRMLRLRLQQQRGRPMGKPAMREVLASAGVSWFPLGSVFNS